MQQQNQSDDNKERETREDIKNIQQKGTLLWRLNVCNAVSVRQTNRAVQTQHNDHEEEDDGKESSCRHICYGFCINDEEQTGTWREETRSRLKQILMLCSSSQRYRVMHLEPCCPTSILGHSVHILLPHLSHVAQHGEDDEARQKAGQAVHRAGDQSVSEMEKRWFGREEDELALVFTFENLQSI